MVALALKESYDIMTDPSEEAFSQRAAIQRDLGRLEGKVDSLLSSVTNLTAALIRSDAERDNLAKEVVTLERKQTDELNKIRTKLYWLAGLIGGGGLAAGAAAQKLIAGAFGH